MIYRESLPPGPSSENIDLGGSVAEKHGPTKYQFFIYIGMTKVGFLWLILSPTEILVSFYRLV